MVGLLKWSFQDFNSNQRAAEDGQIIWQKIVAEVSSDNDSQVKKKVRVLPANQCSF